MTKPVPRKPHAGHGWAVPIMVATGVVVALEAAQRVSVWAGAILAILMIVGGVAVLVRGRE